MLNSEETESRAPIIFGHLGDLFRAQLGARVYREPCNEFPDS